MSILKVGFSGLRYLMGKGAKVVNRALPKIAKDVPQQKTIDFVKQTSIYDPNSFDYIHRLF